MTEIPVPGLFERNLRPRLFLSSDDIPGLREKARHGIPGRALDEILRRCERYTDTGDADYVNPKSSVEELLEGFGGGGMNRTGDAVHCLSYGYIFTGQEHLAASCIEIMRSFIYAPSAPVEICHATLAGQLTYAYDMLFNLMDEKDREQMDAYLRGSIDHYLSSFLEKQGNPVWGIGCNTFLRNFEKYVIALAATWRPDSDPRAIPDILNWIRQSIHRLVDENSAIFEGPGYGWRDLEWMSLTAEVLRRMGAINLWEEEPQFANLCAQWAYLVLPCRRGQNNYCDAARGKKGRPFIGGLLHARRLNDPVLWWVWDQLGGRGEDVELGPAPEHFTWHLGKTVLWEDDQAEVRNPGEAGWPSARRPGKVGISIMRSGWDDDDAYFSLLASERTPSNQIHQQVDSGHFSFFALGEAFSVDSGYADILGRYHSVLRPDGKEPSKAPHVFTQMFYGGKQENFSHGTSVDYATINSGEQWECHWAYRHALFVRQGDIQPYVLILDNVNAGNNVGLYQWILNSEPGNSIDLDHEKERATIHGKKHRLEIAWSFPGEEYYPIPHRLELESDVIDSFPLPGGLRPGIGIRPQLFANLWGYNGLLLSVLLPKRKGEASPVIERLTGRNQFGFSIDFGGVTDTVVANPHTRNLSIGGMQGEATLAITRRDSEADSVWWAAAEAYALSIDKVEVMPRQGNCEILVEA